MPVSRHQFPISCTGNREWPFGRRVKASIYNTCVLVLVLVLVLALVLVLVLALVLVLVPVPVLVLVYLYYCWRCGPRLGTGLF